MVATSDQLRSRTYHFSDEQERRVASLPGVKNIDGLRVTGLAYGNDDLIVIARDMDLWFNNSSGLLDEGDENKARELSSRGEGFVSRKTSQCAAIWNWVIRCGWKRLAAHWFAP